MSPDAVKHPQSLKTELSSTTCQKKAKRIHTWIVPVTEEWLQLL